MNSERVFEKTGRHLDDWYSVMDDLGGRILPHKQIARELQDKYRVDPWWAQSICVEYEKAIGRRIVGQTADGLFQLGVRKTFKVDIQTLWELIMKESQLWADASGASVEDLFTTFVEGSHFRMPWTGEGWRSHSILQIRVLPGGSVKKSVCAVHHEKLPSLDDRSKLKEHWDFVLKEIENLIQAL